MPIQRAKPRFTEVKDASVKTSGINPKNLLYSKARFCLVP